MLLINSVHCARMEEETVKCKKGGEYTEKEENKYWSIHHDLKVIFFPCLSNVGCSPFSYPPPHSPAFLTMAIS